MTEKEQCTQDYPSFQQQSWESSVVVHQVVVSVLAILNPAACRYNRYRCPSLTGRDSNHSCQISIFDTVRMFFGDLLDIVEMFFGDLLSPMFIATLHDSIQGLSLHLPKLSTLSFECIHCSLLVFLYKLTGWLAQMIMYSKTSPDVNYI